VDRREFLRLVAAGGAAAFVGGIPLLGQQAPPEKKPPEKTDQQPKEEPGGEPTAFEDAEVWVAEGGEPDVMTEKVVEAMGGAGKFVKKGRSVLIKPNIAWNKKPEEGANTHPKVVATLVRLCRKAGAKEVIVLDRAVTNPRFTYKTSGIGKAARDAGARLVYPDWRGQVMYVARDIPGAVSLKKHTFVKELFDVDVIINVPVAKHHGLTKLTCAVKNWLGVVGGRRGALHPNIHQNLVDIARLVKPDLVIVDATRIVFRRGPQGKSKEDVKEPKIIIGATNMFTADAYALRVFNEHAPGWKDTKVDDVGYLRLGLAQKLGETRHDKITVHKVEM